ncbi:MAG: FHA domain-containing protein [Thermoleophilaceae bacterium]
MAPESLHVMSGEGRGTTIPLDGELVLGRTTAGLDAFRRDTEISRVHARVWRDGSGNLMIEDLGSRNGTFLNGSRIHGPRLLHAGDWLRTGQTTLELIESGASNGAPRYDALVEEDDNDRDRAGDTVIARAAPSPSSSSGHFMPWPIAAVVVALLAGGGIGAAVAASQRDTAKTTTHLVTREVERQAPPPRLSSPAKPAQLPAYQAVPTSREAFVRAFCGHGSGTPQGVCGCTYVELVKRETYPVLLAQVARSYGGRMSPAISSAARACGASG